MESYSTDAFRIADMHTHIFPAKISARATAAVGQFYDISMQYPSGESEMLLEAERPLHTEKMLICSVATTPKQVRSINDFLAAECAAHPEFYGFAALHADYPDIPEEVDRAIAMGLHGIKLHPDFQRTAIDHPKAYRIYEVIEGRLPVLIHLGDYRHDFSHPRMLAQVMRDFPKLKVLASHLGGYALWDEAEEVLHGGENIRFDTSSSVNMMSPERARRLIRKFGAECCIFGTDFPMWSPKVEAERLLALGLTETEYQGIFYDNAQKFLGF